MSAIDRSGLRGLLAAAAVLLCPAAGRAEGTPPLSVLRLAGNFQARLEGAARVAFSGGLPVVPAGGSVFVSSGQVLFGCGVARVRVDQGESFGFDGLGEHLWFFGPSAGGPVDVEVGAIRAVLNPGAALSVTVLSSGAAALHSISGDVYLVSPDGLQRTLSASRGADPRGVVVEARPQTADGPPAVRVVTTWA